MTALMTADEMVHATGGVMPVVPFHASGMSIDTRTLQPGDLFVALETSTGDGHAFVAEAMRKGAAGAMVHRQDALPDDAPILLVHDTQAGLTALGAFGRARFEGSVIAVTGSVGKTTTKEMLRAALGACGPTHAAHASYNNHWGVPLTLARMPPDAAFGIVEIGMNNPGEIAPLSRLAGPDVAIITTIEAAHIGRLGGLDAIADEKASIMDGVLAGGAVVLPADNPRFPRLVERVPPGVRLIRFGGSDVLGLETDDTGSRVHARIAGEEIEFRVNAPGRHMVMNALAALNAAAAAGADLETSIAGLANFAPMEGRGVRRPILDGAASLLDESYNASSASIRAALAVLRLIPANRRVAVLGDMLELGEFGPAEHAGLAGAVSESADVLYACGPNMKFLYDAVPAPLRGAHAHDSAALAPLVATAIRAGDAVLVKGSLGSRMRLVVDALTRAGG